MMGKIAFLLLYSLYYCTYFNPTLSVGILCFVIAVVLSSDTVMHGTFSEVDISSDFENN